MTEPRSISLIITAHCSGPMLDACLASAAKLDPQPAEVIVTIDGADQGVIEASKKYGFRIVTNGASPGVSRTRNAGANAAVGHILVFADSDVLLAEDHISRIAQTFASSPEISAVIGSYDNAPAARSIVSQYRNLLHHYTHQQGAREAQTFWSGCGAIQRKAFAEAGGFDESYKLPSIEDIELGYRLRQRHHRIRLDPSWQVKHLKKWCLHDLIVTDIGRRAIPWTRLLRRENRMDNDLNIDKSARWSAVLICFGALFFLSGFFWPWGFIFGGLMLTTATANNWPFYRFLAHTNGWPFAILSIPLHWLYFIAATIGFVYGNLRPQSKTTT